MEVCLLTLKDSPSRADNGAIVKCRASNSIGKSEETTTLDIFCESFPHFDISAGPAGGQLKYYLCNAPLLICHAQAIHYKYCQVIYWNCLIIYCNDLIINWDYVEIYCNDLIIYWDGVEIYCNADNPEFLKRPQDVSADPGQEIR